MLDIGERAPEFTLPDQDGRLVSLQALLEGGPVLVYFYPADFTPGCTRQACMFRDILPEAEAVGLRIVGISPQSAESHQRFRDQYQLPFPLLADADKTTIHRWGVDGPFGFGVRRASFVIGRDGTVLDRLVADFAIDKHREWLERARAQMAGEP